MEKFLSMNKQKTWKVLKFWQSQGRQKSKVYPQGAHTNQNFNIQFKISVVLCSIAKGTSEMYQLERE